MQIGALSDEERRQIDRRSAPTNRDMPVENALNGASQLLSSASRGAGLVITAKNDTQVKHVEFIRLSPEKALAVLVGDRDEVENRIIRSRPASPPRNSSPPPIFSTPICPA